MPNLTRHFLAVLIFFAAFAAQAQLTSLLPSKAGGGTSTSSAASGSSSGGTTTAPDVSQQLTEAQGRLRDAQDSMTRLQRRLDDPGLAPQARNELLKQFNLKQTLADRYAQQIDCLRQLQTLDQQIAEAKQERDNWAPPTGTPPWPVTVGDQVGNEIAVLKTRVQDLTKEISNRSDQIANLAREKSDAEVRLRQAQEANKGSGTAAVSALDRSKLDDAKDSLELKSAILLRTDLERYTKDKSLTLLEIRLETATRTWNYYAGRYSLPPELLASIESDIRQLIERDRALELKALAASEATATRLENAQKAYQALSATKVSVQRLAQAKADLDIAMANDARARSDVDWYRQMVEIGGYGIQAWEARAEIYANPRPDAAVLDSIAQRVTLGLVRLRQAREFYNQSMVAKDQEAFDLRVTALVGDNTLSRKVAMARLESVNAQADAFRSLLQALDKFEQMLVMMQSELGLHADNQTFYERLVSFGQRSAALGRSIWRYELFTVDDVATVDGKDIKTTRSVTVGKSIGAIGILVIGFILVSGMIRAMIGLAQRRLGLKSSAATIIGRWLKVIATATLIVMSFNLVQIPLSVFAFLGGALAIGVGFGTQNLLKNLISGVMLLVERPVRIGDLVEIEGVRGRVTSIGIRFSTIHSADGIDTLIPNSELVEKKLTNWTFSNPDVRREVRVGVAYGSDPVQVKNLMRQAAISHPDVMQTPEPMVVLDDLGDSALVFTLRYWLRIEVGTDGRRVDSDLRCEILENFSAAGIDVPFPQRDVRLVAMQPLPVRIEGTDPQSP